MNDADRIYLVHEKIGFPEISEEEQIKLILNQDAEILNKLTPGFHANWVPHELFNKYVKLSKSKFKEYFIKSGQIEKNQKDFKNFPGSDGDWIVEKKEGKFQIVSQERGCIQEKKDFNDKDELVDYLVNGFYKLYQLKEI